MSGYRTIPFDLRGSVMPQRSAAYVQDGDGIAEALVRAVIDGVATGIEVTAGGVTLHLAAWMDTDHWSDDWREVGIDDPDEFIAGLVP